jgi:hypothetical protein
MGRHELAVAARRRSGAASLLARTVMSGAFALALAASCTPKPKPRTPPPKPAAVVVAAPAARPLCAVETASSIDKPFKDRIYPAQNWFVLLLRAYRSNTEMARPVLDCTGMPVKTTYEGCSFGAVPESFPTALTPDDVVVTSVGDNQRLAWVVTEHLPDGQSQGPVALVSIEPRGLAVRAIGVLRAYRHNVVLRLERVGDAPVLVADGQHCDDPNVLEACDRAIRVLPLAGDRFMSGPVVDGNDRCLGSSLLPVRTRGHAGSSRGTKYELEAAVTFGADAILVRENLALSRPPQPRGSRDPEDDSFVSRLQLERSLTVRDGHLVTDGPSLLTKWMASRHPVPTSGEQ